MTPRLTPDVGKVYASKIYAINSRDDLLQIKRLEFRAEIVRVMSDNKKIFEAYDIDPSKLRIIGQVIWFAREVDPKQKEVL